jgi:Tol biopolymer transport system component
MLTESVLFSAQWDNSWKRKSTMKTAAIFSIVLIACVSLGLFAAEPQLRELVVSHTDENNRLQLYHIKEDGSWRRQITNSHHGSMMPAVSPDGSKIVYVQQSAKGMSLWISDVDGKSSKALTESGGNLIPSWLPDSEHIVWMVSSPGKDPAEHSQLRIMNTATMESRRLFSDPPQITFSNSMPVVSPQGTKVAFVSNRSGNYRVWLGNLDGSDARPISPTVAEHDETLKLPIEQKVPAWSPDGKWIAHWEGVEMIHMSKFTGIQDRERDKLIGETWNVWVVDSNGKNKRKAGRGDDPTWSPDGFVTRAFPDPQKGGPKVMVETKSGWEELPIVPPGVRYGRFGWVPQKARRTMSEGG